MFVASRVALVHGGGLVADGAPRQTVTPAHIRLLYGIDVDVQASPCGDVRKIALFPREAGAGRGAAAGFIRKPACADG